MKRAYGCFEIVKHLLGYYDFLLSQRIYVNVLYNTDHVLLYVRMLNVVVDV